VWQHRRFRNQKKKGRGCSHQDFETLFPGKRSQLSDFFARIGIEIAPQIALKTQPLLPTVREDIPTEKCPVNHELGRENRGLLDSAIDTHRAQNS
jgi:hypothetical protein